MKQYIDLCGYKVLPQEVAHIEKHKYFMSLEARYDVGMEAAVTDWFKRVRQDFALWFNRQDITEQMISLNLHLARLKSHAIRYEEAEEIHRFARHWRMHHPRIPAGKKSGEELACEAVCRINFVTEGPLQGACIGKKVCLKAGLHIRPCVHLYGIMHDRYQVRMLIHNDNIATIARFCPQFVHEVEGRLYFDVSSVNILEFLEVAASPSGSSLSILVISTIDNLIRDICRDLSFLDHQQFAPTGEL